MENYTDLKQIREILTNNYHGMKFTQDDMYVVGNRLFINEDGKITTYDYPVNPYFEPYSTGINYTTLPFKTFIDAEVETERRKRLAEFKETSRELISYQKQVH